MLVSGKLDASFTSTRKNAVSALARHGDVAVAILTPAMQQCEDEELWSDYVSWLVACDTANAAQALEQEYLRQEEFRHKVRVFNAINFMKCDEARAAYARLMPKRITDLVQTCWRGNSKLPHDTLMEFVEIGAPAARVLLPLLKEAPNSDRRHEIVYSLAFMARGPDMPNAELDAALERVLRDQHAPDFTRSIAAKGLSKSDDPEATAALADMAWEPNASGDFTISILKALQLVKALPESKRLKLQERLLTLSTNKNGSLNEAAVSTLGYLGDRNARDALYVQLEEAGAFDDPTVEQPRWPYWIHWESGGHIRLSGVINAIRRIDPDSEKAVLASLVHPNLGTVDWATEKASELDSAEARRRIQWNIELAEKRLAAFKPGQGTGLLPYKRFEIEPIFSGRLIEVGPGRHGTTIYRREVIDLRDKLVDELTPEEAKRRNREAAQHRETTTASYVALIAKWKAVLAEL